jgi:hypothetical protein
MLPSANAKIPKFRGVIVINDTNLKAEVVATGLRFPTITIGMTKVRAYGIHMLGSLKIHSVKIASWNPELNYYAITNGSRENNLKK